jgi:prolipoprotein diacylglyceryltransferase
MGQLLSAIMIIVGATLIVAIARGPASPPRPLDAR